MTSRKWLVYVMVVLMSGGAFAGGGKVRGDKGEGDVVQNQVRMAAPDSPFVAALPPAVSSEPEPVLPGYDEMERDEMMP